MRLPPSYPTTFLQMRLRPSGPTALSQARLRGRAQRRNRRRRRFSLTFTNIELPKRLPEIGSRGMQVRIALHHGSGKRPICDVLDEICPNWICQHIKARAGERSTPALFLAQDVIISLILKLVRSEQGRESSAQETHRIELIALTPHAHPYKMQMIRHETIDGTPDLLPSRCVEHEFAKPVVEDVVEPSRGALFERKSPHHNRVSLVVAPQQPRQVPFLPNVFHIPCTPVAALVKARIFQTKTAFLQMRLRPSGPTALSQARLPVRRAS